MKQILIIISLLACSSAISGQASIFQDVTGESAFKMFGNSFSLNTKKESIDLSLNVLRRDSRNNTFFSRWALNAKVSANEGLGNLKSDKGFLLDGEFGVYKGWKTTALMVGPAASTAGWAKEWFLSVNYKLDRSKLYNLGNPPDRRVFSKGFSGVKLEGGVFGYNTRDILYGASISLGVRTNAEDLKPYTISVLQQSSNNDSVLVFKEESAYSLSEFRGHQNFANLNLDFAIPLIKESISTELPQLSLAFLMRYKILGYEKPKFNPGVGLFIGKPGAPRSILLGISAQLLDAFNVADEQNTNPWKRTVINFTAGFKI
jgi:hypothetical protein